MRWARRVVGILVLWPIAGGIYTASVVTRASDEPTAIVCFVSGQVTQSFQGKRTELKLFQLLKPGVSLEAGSRSKATVAFFNGDRYEVDENGSAIVGYGTLEAARGAVKKLAPVSNMADIAPIAKKENPGSRSAAGRIRGGSISNLYPSEGEIIVAESASLRFDLLQDYREYEARITDARGNAIYSKMTDSPTVPVPPGILQPGRKYSWRVQTADVGKPELSGAAEFETLSEEDVRVRSPLKIAAEETKDPSLIALLGELDLRLGLRREACQELRACLSHMPGNQVIQLRLTRLGCGKS